MDRIALAVVLAALSVPTTGWAQGARAAKAEPHYQPAASALSPARAKRATTGAAQVSLAAPTAGEQAELDLPLVEVTPLKVGFPRALPALESEARLHARLKWQALAGGAPAAAISVTSHGANAVRLGVYVSALPLDARVRFGSPPGRDMFEFTGEEILEVLANNLEAGATGVEARTFWSPVIESPTALMEVELPAGVPAEHLRIGVPRLSHLVGAPANAFTVPKSAKACHIDVSCHTAWGPESNAVARMLFTVNGATYACSGTLLADQDSRTQIPYFHTAQHCIPDQATASTIVTYWFYRSAACNSDAKAKYEVRPGGAVLLHVDRDTDVAFLRLNASPPPGALFAGWVAGAPLTTGTPVTGIHHPSGDLQKISFGQIDSYVSCLSPTGEAFLCTHAFVPDAKFYSVTWTGGVTDAGSSGSGLFLDNGRYLVGQLFGGSSSCEAKSRGDYYARFDLTHRAALSRWLGASSAVTEVTPPRLRLRLSTFLSTRPRSIER